MPILAIVPPCAGECRLVRVTGVLIFANSRTCVACVLPAAGPPGHRAGARLRTGGLARGSKTSCRDSHRPVGRSVAPGAIAGMTYRDEQSVPQRLELCIYRIGMSTEAIAIWEPVRAEHPFRRASSWRGLADYESSAPSRRHDEAGLRRLYCVCLFGGQFRHIRHDQPGCSGRTATARSATDRTRPGGPPR